MGLLHERNEVKCVFIKVQSSDYPVTALCRVMRLSRTAHYDWLNHLGQLITAETLKLFRRTKELFKQSRDSLGNREMIKKLRKEGVYVGRYKYVQS